MRAAPGVECISLTSDHVETAFELSSIAGWNQTRGDWQLMMKLPGAYFGVEVEGRLVSTTTLVCYGQTLGWVGMVLTHPDFRRRGFARALVARAMEHAASVGLKTLKLDATDEGRPLYESFGFRTEQPVERWTRAGVSARALTVPENRSDDAAENSHGYALSRSGRIHRYLGPCVAHDADAARLLIEEIIARRPDEGWFWDLLPANEAAVRIASALGFEPVRRLSRMIWGPELSGKNDRIFAIGGFEFG